MTRGMDFGSDPAPQASQPADAEPSKPLRITLDWSKNGSRVTSRVVASTRATFGRASLQDFCLRVEPVSAQENKEKTNQISKSQFAVAHLGDHVDVWDLHSTNGTSLKSSGQVNPGIPVRLEDGEEINVAGVLSLAVEFARRANYNPLPPKDLSEIEARAADLPWLNRRLLGKDAPGAFDFVRFRRLNNFVQEEYVMLFGKGTIGDGTDHLVSLASSCGQRGKARGLDLGEEAGSAAAYLHNQDGRFVLAALREGVRVGGAAVPMGESVVLGDGTEIGVGDQKIVCRVGRGSGSQGA